MYTMYSELSTAGDRTPQVYNLASFRWFSTPPPSRLRFPMHNFKVGLSGDTRDIKVN